ncbi:MAG: outer membrane beta-barrel protein [Bryobacteraceae bacterium]|nr:hypothetical protein [Bryobacterales bacterium]MEB2359692.1 hypothetical protein [Bryobacterales bacterium]NUN00712.1 outer membrane beta-barrel protein [Bryobacteraceae bacterium]
MRTLLLITTAALLPAQLPGADPIWDFAAVGGGSFYLSKTVTSESAKASTGFRTGFAGGLILGHEMHRNIGGEIRYLFLKNDMKVSGNGESATFSAQSHAIHYDLLFYTAPPESAVRPFIAIGGGGKYYRGTGTEPAYQPLSQFVLLSKADQWSGMLAAGAGFKMALRSGLHLRLEFRDYMTPLPKKLLTPNRGAELSGWLHNFVPMLGIGVTF